MIGLGKGNKERGRIIVVFANRLDGKRECKVARYCEDDTPLCVGVFNIRYRYHQVKSSEFLYIYSNHRRAPRLHIV